MTMESSILQYFKRVPETQTGLPSPQGPLRRVIPPAAIEAANREVEAVERSATKKRGRYRKYTPELRAAIGRYAVENGVRPAARMFSRQFDKKVNESTVREFKEAYMKERSRKRMAEDDDIGVDALPVQKRGRPLLVGKDLDSLIQQYVLSIREKRGAVNTSIVIAGARGLLKRMDRTRLAEYGGPATLTKGWARSLLRRMKFSRRMCTTQAQISPEHVEELRAEFLREIIDIVQFEEIPPSLIFNWDQTGLNLVPGSNWTMERKGTKRVGIAGCKDKRMITAVFCSTAVGEFLPPQLIYSGKTNRCHPLQQFPADWSITHAEKHWSNEGTMLQYISDVIVPFVSRVRDDLGVGKEQAALAIFDRFRGQLTANVFEALEDCNIQSVLVPAGCTDQLQPLDLTVNKVAKSFLRQEFQQWYAEEIANQDEEKMELVDLSTARMKSIGARWLIQLYEHLCDHPHHGINGFLAAGILQSLDAGKPVNHKPPADNQNADEEISSEDDSSEDDYASSEEDTGSDD